tara:strand:- start:783 stop:1613 length:831 start_codon:yes stop_codon:yes gene_type:complete
MSKIKIISGWSKEGGSTFSLMELCALFNERGHDCTFYGPHPWHIDKCKGDMSHNFDFEKGDLVIGHFIHLKQRHPLPKKIILSCHEKAIFPLQNLKEETAGFDSIRFISKDQMKWQGVSGTVIPNTIRGVTTTPGTTKGVAGIIGTVCPLKQTHVSVERALADGFKKVLIYGNTLDMDYFTKVILPYTETICSAEGATTSGVVEYMGMELDKQKMYESLSCVYQSNSKDLPEAFGRVRAECIHAGIPYHGNEYATTNFDIWSEDDVYDAWKELLEL